MCTISKILWSNRCFKLQRRGYCTAGKRIDKWNINYFGGTGYLPLPIFSGGRGMCGKTLHMELAKGGRARIERIMSMIEFGRVDPTPLVTHHLYGFDKVEEALYLMRDKPADLVKVMVHCE